LAGISTISPAVKRACGTITLFTFDEGQSLGERTGATDRSLEHSRPARCR
jgi:hypothetical protein